VEISCHGSPVVLNTTLKLLVRAGRLATPVNLHSGFPERSNRPGAGEAVRDLIKPRHFFKLGSAQQVAGSLSHKLKPIKDGLVRLISLLEAGIDFAEDDVSVLSFVEIRIA
jgi:tRNA modification GTPase